MKKINHSIQRELVAHQNIKEKKFWLNQLSGEPVKIIFPYDYQRHDHEERRFDEVTVEISADIFRHLQKLSRGSAYTLNTILVTAVVVLLHKYTGSTDIIVGAPIYKQDHELELINRILALRIRFGSDITFKELLMQVGVSIVETTENYNYPIEFLLKELNIPFTESGDFPLFDITVLLENIHDKNDIRHIHTNMMFSFMETGETVSGVVKYNSLLYKRKTIEGIVFHLMVLLEKSIVDVGLKNSAIDIVTEAEKTQLLDDFNDTKQEYPRHLPLHKLFEEEVEKSPHHIALVMDHQHVSYDHLNRQANRLARILRRNGVGAERIVGLLIHRSLDMMVAILGILKGGGAYLPIEPDTPKKRILSMLTDCRASLLLTDTACVKRHAFKGLQELQSTGPALWETPPRPQILNFNQLPIPDRSLVNYEIYNRNIGQAMYKNCIALQATRGCPYHCLYCHKIWPKKHVFRSAEHIFEEVLFYYKMGVRRFAFIDDIFNLNVKNSSRFFQLVIKNKLDIQVAFPNGIRGDILSKDYIDLMVEAGTIILAFALETASPRLQKLVGKNLNLEKFRENLEYFCEKYPQVIMELFTMHGFPSEAEEEAMMTLNFIKSIKWLHFPFVFILKIYPNTDMARFALENGVTLEQIYRSENLLYNELPETLPFEKSFTLKYQSDFFNNYILLKERLLHVLPHHMNTLSEDEIVQQYNANLPNEIRSFDDVLDAVRITKEELNNETCQDDMLMYVPHLHEKMKESFPSREPYSNALRVLLLDLSQYFSENRDIFYDIIEPPLGLMYLMTYLKQQLGRQINGKVAKSRIDFDNYKELKELLAAFKPDVIGIRTLSLFKDFFHETVSVIRNWGIDVPIIAGGPYATSAYQTILQDRNIDLVVRGEGEVTFCQLIEKIIEHDRKLPTTEILKEINGIAFIPRELERERTGREILIMEELADMMSTNPVENLTPVNGSENLAYIIFTSGTTGKPKGVMTTHYNVTRVVKNTNYIEINPLDRILQLSNYAFDGSVFDIFAAFLNDASLVLLRREEVLAAERLAGIIKRQAITVFFVTTALFNTLVDLEIECFANIRNVLFGGERVSVEHSRKALEYLGKHRIIHVYGPTETTVYATYYFIDTIDDCAGTIPIGKPIANTTAYILDKNFNLVPVGVSGEIYIGGYGLARGYLNRTELTAERFCLRRPGGTHFEKTAPPEPPRKNFLLDYPIYMTGDLGRWWEDGNIEFLGRKDHQVKIRGFRIELGEIESQLLRHPGIKNAIVNVIEGKTGNTYLCTYYVPAPISPRLSASELSLYLAKELPDYMIPAYFILLDHLPLTPTGKIDRKALPVPGAGEEIEYVAPRNKREEDLTEIWANVLGIEKNKISIDSDFFKLGGNSLNATVIMARIHKTFNIKIPLQELFINPTIREFSQYMKAFDRDLFVSIGPAEKKEYYRLSSAQKRQFVLHQMDTDTIVYHIPQVVVLEGKLDKDRLSHTFKKLIERHESLRTSFCMVEDRPVQRIWEDVPLENRYIGIPEFEAEVKEKDRTPCIEDHIKNFIRPFDLTRAPLLRVKLIKEHEDKHIMMVDIHHIIADGTSMNVLVKEFMVLYAGEELPPLKLRYKDFSEWQNSRQQKEAVNLQKAYWLEEFTGDVPVINLPTDYPRAPSPGYEGSSVTFKLSVEQTRALNDLALDCGGTLYMMLLGIYFVLLSKLSGQEDIVIGTPTAGRKHTDLEQIIGMFVNTLALRNYPCGEKTYKAFFNHIKEKTLKAFENQDYQYEELVDLVARNRDLNRNPLFDTMFVLQNTSLQEIEIPGLRVAPYEYENKTSKFDLTLTCVEVEAKLLCIFEYSTKLFKRETIEGFFTYFKNIAEGVINDINRRLGDLEPLTDDEKTRLLLDFNDTETVYPTNKRLHELFVEQVEQTPDHIAVFGPSPGTIHELPAQVTYRELNQKSDQLADALMKRGIQADMIVGIMVNRSVEIVASILGILKSGGVYMPIDPDYPQERINYILADSAAKIQLTADAINRLPTPPHLHLAPWINAPGTEVSSFSTLTSTSTCQVSPANLAYVIYTSGSTGKPKGVLIQHNNVVNQMVGLQKRYAFETGFHHILLAPFTFDPSVQQIFLPLISGGKLHLVPRSCIDYPQELLRYIVSKQIDIVNTVPSLMDLLLDHARDHKKLFFKYIILAGELFSTGLHRKLRSSVNVEKLINIYGPAEATINTTCYECQEVETVIPIGRPLMNYKLVILDKYLKLIPIGVGGEISIMGKGISRGYMNQPELTQQKFIRFPQAPEDRMYMTGDLGKWLPDGNIEFLGRIDHQLKIRGIRIELGEIENILLSHHEIKETVVVSKATERGDAYLCAYIISNKEIQVSELRKYLSTYLPHYMIPSYFVKLAKIPMTAHGKIDRNSLPEPEELILRDDVHYIPPATVMEKKLVEIWEKVLGRNNIGINENFFLMGGDSIKAIQIISRMNSAGYKLEMKDLFQYPVISELAPQVRKLKRIPDQSTITGTLPLTPIQKMFFDRTFLGSFHYHHFNQAVMFYSSQELDKEIIKKVFSKIQAHHDALRMTYKINTDSREVIQINNGLDHPLSLQEYDLKNQENSLKELQYKVNEIQSGIDIEKGPLMRLGLFHLDDGDRILIVIHHLVIDGISWRILVEDLETLYGQYQRGEKPVLPPKTDSFKHWAQSLSEYANSNTLLKEKAYWNQWEANIVPAIRKDFEVNENAVKDTRTISFTMEEEETKLLFTKVNRGFNTDINDILLTALGLGIKKAFEQDRVLLALEGHGREEVLEDMDISRTVGWFTSIYPAVLDMSYAGDLGRQVKEIKETLRRIPHKGLGYGILKYLTAEGFKKESQFKLNPQISFNYLGQFDVDETQISFFEIAKESTGNMQSLKNQRSHDLDVSGMTTANRLTMTFSYNKTHFKPETIASLFNHVQSQLKQIITFCCSKEKMELTPCDFTYKGLSIESIDRLMGLFPDMEDLYTLTPMQEGMLFHALYDATSYSYFEQTSYRLQGKLDIGLVEKSLNELLKRHDILRTAFVYKDIQRPVQVVLKDKVIDLYYQDISHMGEMEVKENIIKEFKEKDKNRSFDLSKDVLMRVSILQVDKSDYQFTWSFHHILMDGWCIGILNNEFFEIYTSYIENRPYRLPVVKPYRTYIQWLEKQDKEISARYWQNYLHSFEEPTVVPKTSIINKRENDAGYRNETVSLVLNREKITKLNKLAARNHVTLNTVTQTIWGIILGKYNRKEDVVFGTVVSGRPFELEGVESMLGLFINTIPVRIRFEEQVKFNRLLGKIQEAAVASEPHHYHPLAEIQSRSPLKQNLIDHLFIFENYPIAEQIEGYGSERHKSEKLALKLVKVDVFEQTNYDFNVIISASNQGRIIFQYNGNVYERDFVERIGDHLRVTMDQVIENEGIEIKEIGLLSDEENHRILYEFNNTTTAYPQEKTISQLFAEQVEIVPDNVALIGQSAKRKEERQAQCAMLHAITYKELNEQTHQLAHILQSKGVGPDTIAAVMVERSIEMIIGILAILKAGGAYLPIAPDYPEDRIRFMLADSASKILVTTKDLSKEIKFEKEIIYLSEAINLASTPSTLQLSPAPATCLAYVIYTSGTTGGPKGVMIENKSVNRLVKNSNYIDYMGLTREDRFLLTGEFTFDISTFEIWGLLLNGLNIYISDKNMILNVERFQEVVVKNKISVIHFIPQLFLQISASCPEIFAKIRFLMVGGDVVRPESINRLRDKYQQLKILHMYGPTENTTFSTFFPIDKNYEERLPIGKPVSNSTVYITDNYNRPQPIGVVGELCVGGDGIARGYLNRPQLTAQKFVLVDGSWLTAERAVKEETADFPMSYQLSTISYIYKTGDLARWLADGNIEFFGRIDLQVKIRGFRIEVGEIETQLVNHTDIKEAVVHSKTEKNGERYLIAYIISHRDIPVSELREYLLKYLPDYMIPSYFIRLDTIPLTPTGKIDRKALPGPELKVDEGYIAPAGIIEKKLVEIWEKVLGIGKDIIGIDENFFQLGGHSLKATLLISGIYKTFHVNIPLKTIFSTPTIRGLSAYIKESAQDYYVSITPVEKKEYYALSSPQKRLYVLQQMDEQGIGYNIPSVSTWEGEIHKDRLEKSIMKLLRRHESLRTSFHMVNEEPVQMIHQAVEFEIEYYDLYRTQDEMKVKVEESEGTGELAPLSKDPATRNPQPATALISSFIRPFDLSRVPLMRVGLIKETEHKYILMVDMHHIISDGTSMNILIKDFTDLYSGKDLPQLKIQFKDFSEWRISSQQAALIKQQESFWLKEFEGEIPILNLPSDYIRPAFKSVEGSLVSSEITEYETRVLKKYAFQEGATLFMVLLAIFDVLLYKLSGQEDIVIGFPIAGRRHWDLESVIGMLVNTLALRNFPLGDKAFKQFLKEIRERTVIAFDNQEYPLEELVEKVADDRDASRNPLFDVMLVMQNFTMSPAQEANSHGIAPQQPVHIANEDEHIFQTSKFDLTLTAVERREGLGISLQYCTKLFKKETAERLITYFKKIVSIVVKEQGIRLHDIEVISKEEQRQILYQFNNTEAHYPRGKTLHGLFAEQAERMPGYIIAVGPSLVTIDQLPMQISYRELHHRANHIAALLRARNVKPGTIVGIMVEPCLEMVVAIVGVLKAGGVFLPLEPESPMERVNFVLNDSNAGLVLTRPRLAEGFKGKIQVINIEESNRYTQYTGQGKNFERGTGPAHPAYVIYTSGTLGRPKGVLISHKNLVNYVYWFAQTIRLSANDKAILTSSFAFDAIYTQFFSSLVTGCELHVIPRETFLLPERLINYLRDHEITYVKMTPSLFNLVVNSPWFSQKMLRGLRFVMLGGEEINVKDVETAHKVCPHFRMMNHYGPTETTIGSIARFIDLDKLEEYKLTPTIGKPLDNTQAYILDKGFNAVPMGVVGGLFIGGDGVGIGYVNKPELTWEKFRIGLLGRNTSIYCTGDLARWKGEGNIEFLGRADDQVKIRGYRVEPGEIESRLLTHPEIREAVLLVREEEMGDKYLCAYIVSARELDMVELREWLSRELPDYMIPSYFVQLEKIPLTPHAKIDRRALPKPELKTQPGYVAPRSGVEERLAGLWSEVLGIERDVISRNSNFFHLGGQSLKVTTLATKIHKELNIKIPLTEFFKTPTIQGLSAYITSTETESYESIEAVEKKEYYALSSAQKRLYILQRMDRDNIAYNMPGIIPLPQDADKEKLHEVFTKMIHRHESLRTSFHLIGDQPVQKIHADVEFKVEYYDLPVTGTGNGYRWEEAPVGQISNASGSQYPKGQELSAMSHIHSFIRPFDLSQAPLLRVGLTKFINHQHILMLDMNHIISDGVSMEILAKDIMSFYEGKSLPRLRIQYKDFARWHNKEKENLGQQEKYWLREFEKEIPVLNLPIDYPRPKLQSFAGNTISFNIGKEETEKLMTLVLAEEATMFMVLLAIFNVLLSKLSGQEDIVVGTGIEGRRHEDLRPIVGMFVNTLALRNFPQPNISFKEFLKQLKKSSIQGFDNQEYQFEELVDKLEVRRDSSRNPLFDVMFQFNNTEIPALDLEKPEANIYAFERRVSKFDLTLWANEGAGELLFTCEYCTKLFKRETIELFIKYFQEITSSVLANPAKKLIETEVISIQRKREILFQLKEKLEKEVEVIEKKANILQERLGKNLDKYKHNTAIECGNNVLTYSQMEERSNHAAHWIINKGIKKETAIGVLMENRPELILIMMGILKAGCVFVPLDSSYPRTRLTTMIAATGIEFVIGDTVNFNKLADAPIAGNQPTEFIFVNHLISDVKPSWWENKTRIRCGGEDRIYIYFTSGTTGKPRAILGKNKSLLHFIDWEIDTFSLGKKSRVSQVTNPGFDAFLRDVLVPLCSGGTICIPGSKETSMDSHELINWVEKSRITLIHCVPGLFRLLNSHRLTRENFKFLKFILLSGERIDPSDLANWYQIFAHRIQLVNLWGTSETTLAKTCYFIQPEDINRVRVPVGKPIPGAKVLILDEGMNLCGELITGELYIQTPYRSSGYYNDVESNRERFIPDPLSHGEDAVLHRTGDLGRWLADGNIDLIGRNDRQVKLRGIRVELAEIESILIRHPAVEEAVVIKKEITKNSELLCGYIVGRTTRDLPDEDQGEKAVESRFIQIREYLSERLPHYMVPEKFLPVETIPRTPNGKIDYNALPDPLSQEKLAGLIQPLRDRVEEKLLVLWTDILGITTININSNFFELGGNSLNIMTLISRIHREFGVRIPLGDFFNNPFLEKQASLIKEARTERYASIEAVEKREYYPLSPAQKRLYVLQQLVKNNTSYNMPYVIPLEGGVEKEKLESVFKGLIERHESLRTSFIIVNEEPVQRIWWETDFSLGFYEIRAEAEAAALVSGYTRPFDLGKAPLLRVNLVTVGLSRRFLFLDMHHIITDGTSQTILEKEFLALYGGKELSSLRLQYKDYSEWYNSAAQKEMIKQQQAYWLKEFGDELPVLHLPTDYPRPVLQGVEGNMVSFRLNAEETGIVKAMVKENDVTLYMFLLAVFNVLLSKLSGQEDIIIGTPIAARRHVDLQLVIGMLVNTLAMRNYPVGGKAFRKFLKEIKQRTLESYENQEYPFEELVDQITINRDTSRNPVFDVMFNLLNQGEYKESRYPMTESDSFRHLKGTSKFDLSLVAMDPGDRVHLNLEYSTKLFTPVSIEKIIGYFKNILKVLSGDRELKLAEIEIMGEEEKKEILRMSCGVEGAYEPGKTIDMLFSDQVQISPDGIAVIGSSAGSNQEFPLQITYRELNEKSAALAGELREKGVRPETIVSIMVDRSLELIMGIVAILKAGGAYLPISPGYPQDRIRYMLADSDVKCLLTTPGLSEEFEKLSIVNCQLLMINEKPPDRRRLNSPPKETIPHLHLSPAPVTSLAYIIYTSGSTGKPKGVVVNHSSLVNLVLNQRTYFRIDTTDRILQFSSICFDASVEQIFIALTSGASLILVVKDILLDIDQFETYISRHLITHLHAVPSFLTQLKLKSMSSLKRMVSGGEICPLELMNTWSRHCDFYNKYGPTETTITSLELRVKELVDNTLRALPIGIPIGNTTVYLFDQWLRPVPLGVTGELYIGGRGVARGYLNRPELTAEKFCLQRPGGTLFEKTAPPGPPRKNFILKGTGKNHPLPHSPIYRTGDLSRWLPDGNIQFLGRIDQQVKIRGFRIELGEIENRLSNHPGIKEAVVAAQEEENGDKYLCAYIVSTKEYVLPELGEYLGKELPDYMIPAYFVPLEKIPLTPNGKIDRKALPKPELRGGAGYTGPRNSLERKLVELWSEALNIEQDVISIDRSFFQLGGHSLRAMILVSKIHKEFDVRVPLIEIFKTPTIRGLASYIKECAKEKYTGIEPVEKKEYYALSSAQKRLYILNRIEPGKIAYNMPQFIPLPPSFNIKHMEKTFIKVIQRHESLRTSFHMISDEPVQRIHEAVDFQIEYFDLKNPRQEINVKEMIRHFVRPFDLSAAPLLHVGVLTNQDGNRILLADMHHIISDGISHEILVSDFIRLYQDQELPPLRLTYKDYSQWQNSLAQTNALKQQEAYWLSEFKGEITLLDMPLDYERTGDMHFEGSSIYFEINETLTSKVKECAGQFNVTLMMFLFSVYNILLAAYAGKEEIIVGTVIAGRRHADLQNIIGFFVNMLAIKTSPGKDKAFSDYLQEVKEKALKAFDNQEYQFEELVSKLGIQREPGRHPFVDVVFVFQDGDKRPGQTERSSLHESTLNPRQISHFDLMLHATDRGDSIPIVIEYSTALFKRATIEEFSKVYREILEQVLENQDTRLVDIKISHDLLVAKSDFIREDTEAWDL